MIRAILAPITKAAAVFTSIKTFLNTTQKDTILVYKCCKCPELVLEMDAARELFMQKELTKHKGCNGLLVLHSVI